MDDLTFLKLKVLTITQFIAAQRNIELYTERESYLDMASFTFGMSQSMATFDFSFFFLFSVPRLIKKLESVRP